MPLSNAITEYTVYDSDFENCYVIKRHGVQCPDENLGNSSFLNTWIVISNPCCGHSKALLNDGHWVEADMVVNCLTMPSLCVFNSPEEALFVLENSTESTIVFDCIDIEIQ